MISVPAPGSRGLKVEAAVGDRSRFSHATVPTLASRGLKVHIRLIVAAQAPVAVPTREDGMSQVEVAELLGRHKSWVCRRLALIERLGSKAKDDLRVGLLTPTAARQIVRLPEGNQAEVLEATES